MLHIVTPRYQDEYSSAPEMEQLRKINDLMDGRSKMFTNARTYMQKMVESCPIPMWIKDINGVMRFVNEAYCKVYDIEPEEYLGKSDEAVWGEHIAKEFRKLDRKVLHGEKVEYSVEKVPNRAGFRQYDHLHVIKFPIKDGPEIVGIAGLITGVFP